ncbi:hypothetical protein, partial [Helcococcus ovis]
EQEKVREAIIKANPELQLSTENITVDEQGNTVITKDGKTTKILGKDLVTKSAEEDKEKYPVVEPDKVKVNNKKELSSEEKKEVEEAVKASNPKAKTVTVKENG